MTRSKILFALAALCLPMPTGAATVCVSGLLPTSIEIAWGKIRDFGSHSSWIEGHPQITLRGGTGTTIGVERTTLFKNGTRFDEVLTGLDDREHLFHYDVIGELPIPAYNVHGEVRLYPVSADNKTLAERCLTYDSALPKAEADAFRESRERILAASLRLLAETLTARP